MDYKVNDLETLSIVKQLYYYLIQHSFISSGLQLFCMCTYVNISET